MHIIELLFAHQTFANSLLISNKYGKKIIFLYQPEKVKKAIVDDAAQRKALYERFLISQKPAQIDPWKARAEGAEADEFTPIMIEA